MTLIPPGVQLASVDLPPPLPHADPREPSPATHRGRGASTPRKPTSPQPSRGSSPARPSAPRAPSSDPAAAHMSPTKAGSPPLLSPTPRSLRAGAPGVPITSHHSLSRPASPTTSIHSSTSAIFERDIELPPVASLTLNPNQSQPHTLHHKSSRLSHLSHGSNLDHTVPAVLDDAVEALSAGTSRGLDGLEIESPAPTGSAMARQPSAQNAGRKSSMSPAGITLSRSPSPTSPKRSPPILGQITTGNPVGGTISPIEKSPSSSFDAGNVPRPILPGRMSTGPQLPGAWSFSTGRDEEKGRKEEDKVSVAPSEAAIAEVAPAGAATAVMSAEETSSAPPAMPGNATHPAPAVPSHLTSSKDKRRISFISYNDLLLSVPTTVTHLGEITSGQLSPEHLPGTVSPNIGTRSPVVPPINPSGLGAAGSDSTSSIPQVEHKQSWDSTTASRAGLGFASGEGEWSREGLGTGLEQRLEDLVQNKAV